MTPRIRITALTACTTVALGACLARAQVAVFDPAVTLKNAAIAALKEEVLSVLSDQSQTLRRMATRLSELTNLGRYSLTDPPAWRIHWFVDDGTYLYANPYHAALNYGDGRGTSFEEVARRREAVGAEVTTLTEEAPAAFAAIAAELATLDIADSTIIAGTDQTGQLRYNGRREDDAIAALDVQVIDPSDTQSATAVVEKISAAGRSVVSTLPGRSSARVVCR